MSNWIEDIRSAVSRLTSTRAGYLDNLNRGVSFIDFWSDIQEEVAIPAGAADQTMPSVVVAGLPSGCTIVRVVAMFKFRAIEESSAGANKLSGAQDIQVRDDTPGDWADAINFPDDAFGLAASAREGGDVIIGDNDIKSTVDGDDTYNFQWDEAVADAASIKFNDVQTGLRVWFR